MAEKFCKDGNCGLCLEAINSALNLVAQNSTKSSGVAQRSTSPNTTKVEISCFANCNDQHAGICMAESGVCDRRKLQ